MRPNTSRVRKPRVEIKVNDVKVPMILDTGSNETVLSTSTWRRIGHPKIEPVQNELKDLSGRSIPMLGTCTVAVISNHRRYVTNVYIHQGNADILGLRAIKTLKIDLNKAVH